MLSVPLFSQDVYEITEAELTELETILSEQENIIDQQRETLTGLRMTIDRQGQTLITLSNTIEQQETRISELGTSFNEFETEARRTMIRNTAIGFGVGTVSGYLMRVIVNRVFDK